MRYINISLGVAMVLAALSGCDKKGAGAGGEPSGPSYALEVTPPKETKAGDEVVAQVKLTPKGEYKVNMEYPTKLTVEGPSTAQPAKLVLNKKDAVKMAEAGALFAPRSKVSVAGKHKFSATFKFSVCTKKLCEMKTEKLTWVASVKK